MPARLLIRFRLGMLLVLLSTTAMLVPGIAELGIGYSVASFLESEDRELVKAVAHYDRYPQPDSLFALGFETVDPLGEQALDALEKLETGLRAMPEVRRTLSLRSAPGLDQGAALERRIRESHVYRRLLVELGPQPRGAGALAIFVQLGRGFMTDELRGRIEGLAAAALGRSTELFMSGIPVMRNYYVGQVRHDQRLFLPLAAGLSTLFVLFLLPSLGLALATLSVVPLTLIWTFGTLGFLGHGLTLLTSTLPTLLMVIAVADAVHMSLRYRELRFAGQSEKSAGEQALRQTFMPCLLTSVTTGIGFGSLLLAAGKDLQDLGFYASLGIAFAFLLTVLFLPALLPSLSGIGRRAAGHRLDVEALARLSRRMARVPAGPTLAVFVALLLAGVLLGSRVRQDSYFTEDLWPESGPARGLAWFEEHFAGTLPGELLIEAKTGRLDDPDRARELGELLDWVEKRPEVLRTLSHVDAMRDGVPGSLLPGALSLVPLALVDAEFTSARVLVFMRDAGTVAVERYFQAVTERASHHPELDVRPVGFHVLGTRAVGSMVDEIKGSFFYAFLLISVLMTFFFRSLRHGLIALLPNCFPLVMTLGFMGLFGVNLRPVVVITFAIAFGLAVDNTIHILSRFRYERAQGHDVDRAVEGALEGVGAAAWTTSLLLLLGFSVLLFSGFKASFDFGLLACTTIFAALAGDLLLLPALLRSFAR